MKSKWSFIPESEDKGEQRQNKGGLAMGSTGRGPCGPLQKWCNETKIKQRERETDRHFSQSLGTLYSETRISSQSQH